MEKVSPNFTAFRVSQVLTSHNVATAAFLRVLCAECVSQELPTLCLNVSEPYYSEPHAEVVARLGIQQHMLLIVEYRNLWLTQVL